MYRNFGAFGPQRVGGGAPQSPMPQPGPVPGALADVAGGGAPYQAMSPYTAQMQGLQRGAQGIDAMQGRMYDLQRRCAAGDGRACQDLQVAQQRMGQMQGDQYNAIKLAQMPRGAGSMGVGRYRGGAGGADPSSYAAMMLQSMYGRGGGGGMMGLGW